VLAHEKFWRFPDVGGIYPEDRSVAAFYGAHGIQRGRGHYGSVSESLSQSGIAMSWKTGSDIESDCDPDSDSDTDNGFAAASSGS